MKVIDSGKTGVSNWKRPVTATTVHKRFPEVSANQLLMAERGERSAITQVCPKCGAGSYVKSMMYSGEKGPYRVFWPQCLLNEDKDHGYSKFSEFAERAPMGRPPRGEKAPTPPKAPEPTPEDPAPVPDAPKDLIIPLGKNGKPEIVHPQIIRAARYILAGERNIYLSGPAGTGKTFASAQLLRIIAANDSRWANGEFHEGVVGLGTMNPDLVGYLDRTREGKFVETWFTRAIVKAGVTLVDEADKGNPNLAGVWNMPLANGKLPTPGGTLERHPDNVIVFVGNTTGHAANKQYGGSVRQDFATLDRFAVFFVDYDDATERAAIGSIPADLKVRVNTLRRKAKESGLQRIVGTRWLGRVVRAMKVEGLGAAAAIDQIVADEGWSNDEKLAAGLA